MLYYLNAFEHSKSHNLISGLSSYSEFLENTKRDVSKQDPEWQPINNQDVYTSDEYEAFQRQREAQIEKMKADGLVMNYLI